MPHAMGNRRNIIHAMPWQAEKVARDCDMSKADADQLLSDDGEHHLGI
jgi:hypothetical protein